MELLSRVYWQACNGTVAQRPTAISTQIASPKSDIVIELSLTIKSKQSFTCSAFDHFAEIVYMCLVVTNDVAL